MIFFIAFPFLAAGCATFLICAAIPPLRRFALSLSLWFAACIPCLLASVASIVIFNLGLSGLNIFFQQTGIMGIHFHQTTWIGWIQVIATAIATFGGATAITLFHGVITRRLTLALFRVYVAGVSFGVGLLTTFFVAIACRLGGNLLRFATVCLLGIVPAALLAYINSRNAKQYRGDYPQIFPIVSREEFVDLK